MGQQELVEPRPADLHIGMFCLEDVNDTVESFITRICLTSPPALTQSFFLGMILLILSRSKKECTTPAVAFFYLASLLHRLRILLVSTFFVRCRVRREMPASTRCFCMHALASLDDINIFRKTLFSMLSPFSLKVSFIAEDRAFAKMIWLRMAVGTCLGDHPQERMRVLLHVRGVAGVLVPRGSDVHAP